MPRIIRPMIKRATLIIAIITPCVRIWFTGAGIKLFIIMAMPAMPPKVKSLGVWKK